ncbi:MAG: hypothetical protein ACRDGO_02315 [Actinomycetota bacterium]
MLLGRLGAVLLPIAIVGGLFLWPIVSGDRRYPTGYDTTKYIFRVNAVIADGVDSLNHITPPSLRLGTNPERPGYPVIASLTGGVLRMDALGFATVFPAVMAVAIALSAGAFAVVLLRQPGWAFPLFAIATGASVMVAVTAVGGADNLIIDSFVLGLFVCSLAFADRQAGFTGALLLSAGAALVHWSFGVLALALLSFVAVVFVVPSFRHARNGGSWWETPALRLAAVIGGSVVVGTASMLVAPALPGKIPHNTPEKIQKKNAIRLPPLRLPFWAVASTAGAAASLFASDQRRRMTTVLLVGWGAAPLAAAILFRVGWNVPPYRFAAFALALPILATLLVTDLGRLVARRVPVLGILVCALLAVALVALATSWSADYWWSQPSIPEEQFDQSRAAGRYLTPISEERPVVYITSHPEITLPDHVIRGGVPPSFVDDVYLFPGTLREIRFLQEDPEGELLSPTRNRRTLAARELIADVLLQDPIVLYLSAFNGQRPAPAGLPEVQPGVFVVQGPPSVVEPAASPGSGDVVLDAIALTALLAAVGIGWAVSLAPGALLARAGLAMAFGLAVLAVAGTVASKLGLPLQGGAGTAVVVVAALGGWIVKVFAHLRRRSGSDQPAESVP